MWRDGFRVNRDIEAAALELPRGAESGNAASKDGCSSRYMGERHFRCQVARPPCERHPATAVAIVVDERFPVERFGLHDESGSPIRSETHGRVDDAIPGHVHWSRDRAPGARPSSLLASPFAAFYPRMRRSLFPRQP